MPSRQMPLTDSHSHLASAKFESDEIPSLIERAHGAGVARMVSLGTDLVDCPQNIELARRCPEIHACVGIHPCDVHEVGDDYLDTLLPLVDDAAAIGETGLDYFHPAPGGWTDESYRQRQRDLLVQHFELAANEQLNVVIHTRDKSGTASFDDALAIYSDFADRVKAVFHCFIGSVENAQKVINLGGYVSFTGIATFKNPGTVLEVAKAMPAGRFMVETDSPYLAPVPNRGKRNEPSYVAHTAAALAIARGESLEELTRHTEQAVETFFRLS